MENEIRTVLDTAVWAPSGDNSQPWSFTLSGDTVRVHLLPDRDNPILNFKLSGTYIAHGALIENIVLAAPLSGLRAEARILPDPADPYCTAEITFAPTDAASDPLSVHIKERHTNRKPYAGRLDKETVAAMAAQARENEARLLMTEEKAEIREIAAASAVMEQVALETPELRKLFVSDILWTAEENQAGKQGLYIKTMELPPPARFLLRNIGRPTIAKIADAIGFPNIARLVNTQLYASAPLMGLITIAQETPSAYISAGRMLERLWLEATARGLAFHPVTGILFLARSIEQGDGRGLLPQHFDSIRGSNGRIKAAFGAASGDIPAMLFRAGYAHEATARSARKKAEVNVA